MTALSRPVTRFVSTAISRRLVTLAVTLAPEGLVMREKGRRTSYLLPFEMAWWKANRLEADRAAREKAQQRKARRGK